MNRKTTRVILLVGLVIFSATGRFAIGQLVPEPVKAERPESSPAVRGPTLAADANHGAGTFQRTDPRIIFMEDDEQNLIPVVMSLREFDAMYLIANRLAQPPETPRFFFTDLHLEAQAEGDRARIDVRLSVRTLIDGWQLMPIHMGGAQLLEQPQVVSGKTHVLARFNEQTRGYELWLRGERGAQYDVEIKLLCSIRKIGAESQLRLSLPRAATSQMQIWLPGEDLVALASDTMVVTSQEGREGKTHLTIRGLVADFQLAWRSPRAARSDRDQLFEVDGEIDVQVDSRGIVTSDVRLNITAYEQAIRRLTVRIPATTRLLHSEDSDYTLQIGATADGYQELEIEFEEPELEPVVELNVQVDKNSAGAYDLASYEVLGALRQSGVVSLVSQGDWRLSWKLDRFARRISDPDASRRVKAIFEYFQPNQIQLALLREQTHLTVEPFYVVKVYESEALLTAVYRYRTRGAKAASVKIDLGQWELSDVGPENVRIHEVYPFVQPVETASDRGDGLLDIPLTSSVPNEFEIQLEARRVLSEPLTEHPRQFSLHVPPPRNVDLLLQSTVIVDSAPNVIMMRDTPGPSHASADAVAKEETTKPEAAATGEFEASWADEAFAPTALPDQIARQLDDVAKTPLCFHMRNVGIPPPLHLLASTLERTTTVRCETEITEVSQNLVGVRQRFLWKIDNVQLPRATLMVANEVYGRGDLQITVEGQQVAVVPGPTSFAVIASQRTPISVPLPSPALGNFEIVAEYHVPIEETSVSPLRIDLHLVLPRLEPSTSRRMAWLDPLEEFMEITGPTNNGRREPRSFEHRFLRPRIPGYRIGLASDSLWTSATDAIATQQTPSSLLATTDQLLGEIPITLQQVETNDELVVDRAWFQTWYTHSTRQDRAVFRILGRIPKRSEKTQPTIGIRLPRQLDVKQFVLIVDGQRREDFVVEDGVAEVDVIDATREVHVIEVVYPSETRDPPGKLTLHVPSIEGANMLGQWFWHLVVPRSECLLSAPGHLTPAYRWSWSGWLPKSETQMTQTELEDWIDSVRTQKTVLWGSNEYLFGALGPVEGITVRTTTLPLFVLLSSGTVLVVGVLLIYTQRQQRLYLLVPVAALLTVLIFVNPTLAAIAGQAAVLGLVLIMLATLLSWLFRQAGKQAIQRTSRATTISTRNPRPHEHRDLAALDGTALSTGSSQHPTTEPSGL